MSQERIGLWLIGAWGGVSTTVAVGLAGLQAGVAPETALVTSLPKFTRLKLADWSQFVIGGHEIRETTFAAEAEVLYNNSRVFDRDLLNAVAPRLAEFDKNIRPGTLINVGSTIEKFAGPKTWRFEAKSLSMPSNAFARTSKSSARRTVAARSSS